MNNLRSKCREITVINNIIFIKKKVKMLHSYLLCCTDVLLSHLPASGFQTGGKKMSPCSTFAPHFFHNSRSMFSSKYTCIVVFTGSGTIFPRWIQTASRGKMQPVIKCHFPLTVFIAVFIFHIRSVQLAKHEVVFTANQPKQTAYA